MTIVCPHCACSFDLAAPFRGGKIHMIDPDLGRPCCGAVSNEVTSDPNASDCWQPACRDERARRRKMGGLDPRTARRSHQEE